MSPPAPFRRLAVAALGLLAASAAHAAWIPDGVPLTPPLTDPDNSYVLQGMTFDGFNGAYVAWRLEAPFPDFSGSQFTLAVQRVDVLGDRPAPWGPDGATVRTWINSSSFGTYFIYPLRMLDDHAHGAILPVIDDNFTVEYLHSLRAYHIDPAGAVSEIPFLPSYAVNGVAVDGDGAGGLVLIGL